MSGDDRPYITCREVLDFLDLYLENELPEERRAEFVRHLEVCRPCRDYIRQYQAATRLGRAAEALATTPEDVPEELVAAVLKARRR